MTVSWTDLLERPFRRGGRGDGPLDCGGVAELICVRAGLLEEGELTFPRYGGQEDLAEGTVNDFLARSGQRFVQLGTTVRDATEVGDFVVTDPYLCGCGTHLLVLAQKHPRTWLTAVEGHGVRSTDDRGVGRHVLGAYRVRPR